MTDQDEIKALQTVAHRLSDDERYYLIDTVSSPLPRVSTVLDCYPHPGIEKWKRDVGFEKADQISKTSTDFGSLVHLVCEHIDLGLPCTAVALGLPPETDNEIQPKIEPYARAWRNWKAAKVAEVIYVEHFVWSEVYGFAGTIDRVLLMKDGRLVLGDLKTSKTLGRTYDMQCIAYRVALKERENLHCDSSIIIQMPSNKPGMLGIYEPEDPEGDWRMFQNQLETFYDYREHEDQWKHGPKLEPWGIAA